jgi:hypothetical protein
VTANELMRAAAAQERSSHELAQQVRVLSLAARADVVRSLLQLGAEASAVSTTSPLHRLLKQREALVADLEGLLAELRSSHAG